MKVHNLTPFEYLLFEDVDAKLREQWVLVLRGTFRIVPWGVLELSDEQLPIVEADVFRGEPNESSLIMEGDVVPPKKRSDVMLNAVAHAPGGLAAPSWLVRARVGALDKTLRVTGPRRWVREGDRFRLEDPEACTEVPIIYEHAFGGVYAGRDVFERNPVGVGYVPDGETPGDMSFPAPRIESPDDPVEELGKVYAPQGFGPMTRSWEPRVGHAGSFDDRWLAERWPNLPEEFDSAHWNAAHPDLVYPRFLYGDEEVVLENLTPEGELRFHLPRYAAVALLNVASGPPGMAPAFLDTLLIDVPAGLAHLTWRAAFPADDRIEEVLASAGVMRGRHD